MSGSATSLTKGFDIGRMLMLLDEARHLAEAGRMPGTDWGEQAERWLADHAEWHAAEEHRQAADEPRERIDRPEREQEPTVLTTTRERDEGWRRGRDHVDQLRHDGRYTPEQRALQLGQAHLDVHQLWSALGIAEGHRDALHRIYGYPR